MFIEVMDSFWGVGLFTTTVYTFLCPCVAHRVLEERSGCSKVIKHVIIVVLSLFVHTCTSIHMFILDQRFIFYNWCKSSSTSYYYYTKYMSKAPLTLY